MCSSTSSMAKLPLHLSGFTQAEGTVLLKIPQIVLYVRTLLKGVWHEIFDRFFSRISIPLAPEYSLGVILNFYENSWWY